MKRLSASLRTVSRKIKALHAIMLFSALPLPLFPQGALLSAEIDQDRALVTLRLVDAREKQLVSNAYQGRSSSVRFDFRIYRKSRGMAAILGDRIEKEQSITKQGYWDPFTKSFVVTGSDGSSLTTPRPEDYLDKLLGLESYFVNLPGNRGDYYLLARVQLKEINLQVPFSLLDPVLPETRVGSPWVRWEFSFGEDG